MLIAVFSANGQLADLAALKKKADLNDDEWEDLLQYTVQVYIFSHYPAVFLNDRKPIQVLSNLVNFKTFGFTKIIPRVSADKFEAVVKSSANADSATTLWEAVGRPEKDIPRRKFMLYHIAQAAYLFCNPRS